MCVCVGTCRCTSESDSATLPWWDSTCSSLLIDRCLHTPLDVVNICRVGWKCGMTATKHTPISCQKPGARNRQVYRRVGDNISLFFFCPTCKQYIVKAILSRVFLRGPKKTYKHLTVRDERYWWVIAVWFLFVYVGCWNVEQYWAIPILSYPIEPSLLMVVNQA